MNIPEIYVLWHPSCELGEILARRIYEWLRPGNGLGPQVYYRSHPAPEALPNGLPIPIQGEIRSLIAKANNSNIQWEIDKTDDCSAYRITNLQIVIPLIDEHMVSDQTWRYWLTKLGKSDNSKRRTLLPVALDATAYNTPPEIRKLNFLRPSGLPLLNSPEEVASYNKVRLNQNPTESDQKNYESVEFVVRSFLKQLTETMARILLPRSISENGQPDINMANLSPPKVTIFLSHAKADGRIPAQRLRDYIYSQTQMAAFYDENDIAFSAVFASILDNNLGSPNTAAMIAIRSARYVERPWCRREISLFRKPKRKQVIPANYGEVEHWRLSPLIVVEAMEPGSKSYGTPEFGNAPIIRWTPDDHDIEEQIVTRVIRDSLIAAYHASVAESIPTNPSRIRVVLNWIPDPTTLLHVHNEHPNQELEIIYPGQGLSGAELDVLYGFFPKHWFYSFEEILS